MTRPFQTLPFCDSVILIAVVAFCKTWALGIMCVRKRSVSPREGETSLLPTYQARSAKAAKHSASSAAVEHHSQSTDYPRSSNMWGCGCTLVHQEPGENPWWELSTAASSVTPMDRQIFALRFLSPNADSMN